MGLITIVIGVVKLVVMKKRYKGKTGRKDMKGIQEGKTGRKCTNDSLMGNDE